MVTSFPAKAASADDAAPVTIFVLVNNSSRASQSVVDGVERAAGRIFAQAGVRIIWFDCSGDASSGRPPCLESSNAIRLHLLSTAGPKSGDNVWGLAIHPRLASVYYQYISDYAAICQAPISSILGCAIAHEIGHLLLGADSHYGIGTMEPHWSFQEVHKAMMGILVFTRQQSQTMCAEVRRRNTVRP